MTTHTPVVHTSRKYMSRGSAIKEAQAYMQRRPWWSIERDLGSIIVRFKDGHTMAFNWEPTFTQRLAHSLFGAK